MAMMSLPTTGATMGLTMTDDHLTLRRRELHWGITTELPYIGHTCLGWSAVTSGTVMSSAGYSRGHTGWTSMAPFNQ